MAEKLDPKEIVALEGTRGGGSAWGLFVHLQGVISRERDRFRTEIVRVQGLMPLLMKQRNGERWTQEDLSELRAHLRSLSAISPYALVVLLPGSSVLLALLAWWLDRRRQKRPAGPDRS